MHGHNCLRVRSLNQKSRVRPVPSGGCSTNPSDVVIQVVSDVVFVAYVPSAPKQWNAETHCKYAALRFVYKLSFGNFGFKVRKAFSVAFLGL